MSGNAEGPALPWARQVQEQAEEPIEVDLPSKLGLSLERIEVKWEVAEEEDEEGEQGEAGTTVKWWGARIEGKAPGETDGEGRQCYILRYDAANGFEEETRRVTFLDEHALYDLQDDDELAWRREGEAWEEPEEALGEGGEGNAVLQLEDVAAAIQRAERRRGKTVEQECLEMVSQLPAEQQRTVIAGFSSFTEVLSVSIKELCQQKGPGYVVTEEDMHVITQKAMQQMRGATHPFYP